MSPGLRSISFSMHCETHEGVYKKGKCRVMEYRTSENITLAFSFFPGRKVDIPYIRLTWNSATIFLSTILSIVAY